MIDKATGDIIVGAGETVGARTTDEQFLRGDIGGLSQLRVANGSWVTRSINAIPVGGRVVAAAFTFEDGVLRKISMSEHETSDPTPSWDTWSEARELALKSRHDEWLKDELGPPPYEYAWGRLSSSYDPRSGGSSITITYFNANSEVGHGNS
ncbi:MAG: hypothetical protein WKG00_23355 [Polyangiaceae bacterium]